MPTRHKLNRISEQVIGQITQLDRESLRECFSLLPKESIMTKCKYHPLGENLANGHELQRNVHGNNIACK